LQRQRFTYTLQIDNAGPGPDASVTLTDALPAEVMYVPGSTRLNGGAVQDDASGTPFPLDGAGLGIGPLAAGGSASLSFDVVAPGAAATLVNQAVVSGSAFDPEPANNSAAATTQVSQVSMKADLALSKSAAPDPVTGGGSTLRYTLGLRNDGDLPAEGVTLADTLPPGVTFLGATPSPSSAAGGVIEFALGSLAAADGSAGGADEATVVIDVRVDLTSGTLTNRATAATTTYEEDLADNSAQAVTTVIPPAEPDLTLTKQAPAAVATSQRFTYVLSVANAGSGAAEAVTLVDALPAGVSYVAGSTTLNGAPVADSGAGTSFPLDGSGLGLGALAAGATVEVRFDVTAPSTAATVTNTASVSTTSAESDLSDNQGSAVTQVSAQADLAIDKQGPATAVRRAFITYTLIVSNAGPSTSTSVVVSDSLPAGVTYSAGTTTLNGAAVPDSGSGTAFPLDAGGLSLGSLGPGAAATITFEVRMPNSATTVVNQAGVSSATPDPNSANNTDSVSTIVQ
jgi:uncharacterized repeat protein (TIGR01451 family)